jgi:hypothetical protein
MTSDPAGTYKPIANCGPLGVNNTAVDTSKCKHVAFTGGGCDASAMCGEGTFLSKSGKCRPTSTCQNHLPEGVCNKTKMDELQMKCDAATEEWTCADSNRVFCSPTGPICEIRTRPGLAEKAMCRQRFRKITNDERIKQVATFDTVPHQGEIARM